MKKRLGLALGLALLMATSLTSLALAGNTNNYGAVDSGSATFNAPFAGYNSTNGVQDDDNQIGNANNTGENSTKNANDPSKPGRKVIKNVAGQKTHGSYQNNTNSCASCHQTHTGASKQLLFKNGIFATCTACHDGTLGFYNVFTSSSAGTFGGTKAGNASVHLANGNGLFTYSKVSAAPGGNPTGTDKKGWASDFTCASCHAPHGSYSDRLLQYNPNNMGNSIATDGGIKLSTEAIIDVAVLPTATKDTKEKYVVRTTGAAVGDSVATADVIVVYKKKVTKAADGSSIFDYVVDNNPWLYGYDWKNNYTYQDYWIKFNGISFADDAYAGGITVKYNKGYAIVDSTKVPVSSLTTATIPLAYVVNLKNTTYPMTLDPTYGTTYGVVAVDERVYDEEGIGLPITKFCAACHTDYKTHSGGTVGLFSYGQTVYRHSTDEDKFTCLKCHYAHGTDVTVMKDAKDNTVASLTPTMGVTDATLYLVDKNPSSALKRYTNQSVCWKCHTDNKATTLKNTNTYWDNTNAPHGPDNW